MCNNSAIILHSLWIVKWFPTTFNEKETKTFQSDAQQVVEAQELDRSKNTTTEGSIIIASEYYQKIWNKNSIKSKESLIHFPVKRGRYKSFTTRVPKLLKKIPLAKKRKAENKRSNTTDWLRNECVRAKWEVLFVDQQQAEKNTRSFVDILNSTKCWPFITNI